MKRPFFTFLVCSILLLSFVACEKESLSLSVEGKEISLTPEQQLRNAVQQEVIFQFSSYDLETGIENGWLIDDEGSVKLYFYEHQYPFSHNANERWTEIDLETLYNNSGESLYQVDPSTLLNKFNLIQQIEPDRLTDIVVQPSASQNTSFYAFSKLQNNENSDPGCYRAEHYDYNGQTPTLFNRMVLQISGRSNRVNQSQKSGEILSWLSDLNQNLQ